MVQTKENKNQQMNIRKMIMYKRREQKGCYKRLTGEALDSDFETAQKIREEEQDAWNRFKFFSDLQEALDRVEK